MAYTVKAGDTVWSLAKRELAKRGNAKPSNAQINALVRTVSVPGGNRNAIKPGQKVSFPSSAGAQAADRASGSAGAAKKAAVKKASAGARAADRYGSGGVRGVARAQSNPGASRRSETAAQALARVGSSNNNRSISTEERRRQGAAAVNVSAARAAEQRRRRRAAENAENLRRIQNTPAASRTREDNLTAGRALVAGAQSSVRRRPAETAAQRDARMRRAAQGYSSRYRMPSR